MHELSLDVGGKLIFSNRLYKYCLHISDVEVVVFTIMLTALSDLYIHIDQLLVHTLNIKLKIQFMEVKHTFDILHIYVFIIMSSNIPNKPSDLWTKM